MNRDYSDGYYIINWNMISGGLIMGGYRSTVKGMLYRYCLSKLISIHCYLSPIFADVQAKQKGRGQEHHKACESNPCKHGQPNEEFKDYRRSISGHSEMKLHGLAAVRLCNLDPYQ